MDILVTGTAGFIGSAVAASLLERGDRVLGIDNLNDYYDPQLKKDRIAHIGAQCPGAAFRFELLDIGDNAALQALFDREQFDSVVHLAAQAGVRYSLENPVAYETANNLSTLHVLEACRHSGIKTVVFASSSSVYGENKKVPFSVGDPVDHPISLYAATKRYNELMAFAYHHLYGINCTGLRFFTVYGPWGRPDMAYFKFTQNIVDGKPIDVYNHGKMRRDFTYITDIVAGVLAAIDKSYPYEIFNLGNSNTVELGAFISCLEKELGKTAEKQMLPLQPGDVLETFADIDSSREKLGFNPKTKIEEGLREFVRWHKSYFNLTAR